MITINGKTRICGLLGNPVEHTLSPVIHNYLAERMGQNLVYLPFLVEHDVKAALEGAFALNLLGLNVTVPYKSAVLPYLVKVDEDAKRIGAVNALVRQENGFKGYNTDFLGLHRAMSEEGILLKGKTVVLLGAGGAAMSIAYLCAREQAREIYILNRTLGRAEAVAASVGQYFPDVSILPMALSEYSQLPDVSLTVIQATTLGLFPNCNEAVIEDRAFYKKVACAVDIIYNPQETKFMRLIREQGGQACNGMKMLLYQAVSAYELWNDCRVPTEIVQEVLQQLKKEFDT